DRPVRDRRAGRYLLDLGGTGPLDIHARLSIRRRVHRCNANAATDVDHGGMLAGISGPIALPAALAGEPRPVDVFPYLQRSARCGIGARLASDHIPKYLQPGDDIIGAPWLQA